MDTISEHMVVECTGDLTITHAEILRERVLSALERAQTVDLDCSLAGEADISFLQLVIAARLSAAKRGVALRVISGGNETVAMLARAAGLIDEDDDPHGAEFWMKKG